MYKLKAEKAKTAKHMRCPRVILARASNEPVRERQHRDACSTCACVRACASKYTRTGCTRMYARICMRTNAGEFARNVSDRNSRANANTEVSSMRMHVRWDCGRVSNERAQGSQGREASEKTHTNRLERGDRSTTKNIRKDGVTDTGKKQETSGA